MAEVLSENNLKVLELIEEKNPSSITELAKLCGRSLSNLSRTLKTFEKYGIVEIKQENQLKRPILSQRHFKMGDYLNYGTLTLGV